MSNNIWSENEINFLKEYYSKFELDFCLKNLNRTKQAISSKVSDLKIKNPIIFSDDDIKFLIENYNKMGAKFCAQSLNKNLRSVAAKASRLKLHMSSSILGNEISIARTKNNYKKFNFSNFTAINSKYSAYILGYIWADGHIRMNGNSCNTIINLVKDDAEFLYKIMSLVCDGWRIGKEVKKFWKNDKGEIKQAKNQRYIISTSKELYYFLFENDYANKSNINFNNIWSKIPENLKSFFILGLCDGDGSFTLQKTIHKNKVYFHGSFVITSTYNYDWSTLEKYFIQNNIEYKIERITVKLGQKSRLTIRKDKSIDNLYKLLYSDDFHGLERKYVKLLNYFNIKKQKYEIKNSNNILYT